MDDSSPRNHQRSDRINPVEADQISALMLDVAPIGAGFTVLFILGGFALWGHVPTVWFVAWWLLFFVESFIRYYASSRFSKASLTDRTHPRWRSFVLYINIYAGIVYGLSILLLFVPLPLENFVLLVTVVAGLCCLVLTLSHYYLPVVYLSGVPLLLPLVCGLWISGQLFSILAGVLIVFIGALVSKFVYRTTHEQSELIKAAAQNSLLMDQLQLEKIEVENARNAEKNAAIEKSRFIAAASHDLRQPLHALSLFHGLLDQECVEPETQNLSNKMEHCIVSLIHQFDSLLDVSRLDAGVVSADLKSVRVDEMIDGLVANYGQSASAKGLKFNAAYEPNLIMHTDYLLVQRIISNLISNAVNYTREGEVTLTLNQIEEHIVLTISDTGVGIESEELNNIFDEYYRINKNDHVGRGFGLGLAIVAKMCVLLDIEISVESELGVGTSFVLKIPLGESDLYLAPEIEVSPENFDGFRVLIIDDDQNILDGMSATLKRWGCSTKTAQSAQAAAEAVEKGFSPQLLMCDFRLSNSESGVQTSNLVKQMTYPALPVIIITGDSSTERLNEIIASGFSIMNKPLTPAKLKETLTPYFVAETKKECAPGISEH